jgi:FixJ family two-component response regulator
MTAYHDEEIRSRALRQGAAGFLDKPFDAMDLLGAIELFLNTPPED